MRLSSVDLNLLVALDALLEERNVSRAAERLLVGQPAMSATLARLRNLFDDPLLVREGRSLRATPLAESLVEPLRAVLSQIESIVNVSSVFDPLTAARTFTITASDYVTLVLLRPLLERLPAIAPNVQIHVRPLLAEYMEQVRRNQTDMLILPRELMPSRMDLPVEPLFTDTFVCVVDAANVDVGEEITLEQFSSLPHLELKQGLLTTVIETRLDQLAVPRRVEMVAGSFVMAPFLLPGTRLVAVIQKKLAETLLADGAFRMLESPVPLDSITESMCWTPRQTADAGHVWLRNQLRELAATV